MTTRIEGGDELLRNLRRFGQAGKRQGERAVRATAEKVRRDANKAILDGPATGRIYEDVFATINGQVVPVGKRSNAQNLSATHQASAPGEAPMNDTGNLVSSSKADHMGLTSDVKFTAPYAMNLELGTMKVEARPFLYPAMEANRAFYIRKLEEAVSRAAREAAR